MALTNDEILSIAESPDALYVYRDRVTSEDLIKIVDKICEHKKARYLISIIEIAITNIPGILTEDVKYEILYKVSTTPDQQPVYSRVSNIGYAFNNHKIQVSDDTMNRVVSDIIGDKQTSNTDKAEALKHILYRLEPKLTKENIAKVAETLTQTDVNIAFWRETFISTLMHLLKDKDYLCILEHDKIFDILKEEIPNRALEVVRSMFCSENIDTFIKLCHKNGDSLLFKDDLVKEMFDFCLKEHKTEAIFEIDKLFNYINKPKSDLAQQALRQLIEDKKEDFVDTNKNVWSCVFTHNQPLASQIPFTAKSIQNAPLPTAVKILNSRSLSNPDMEYAYIQAYAEKTPYEQSYMFDPITKLSAETSAYKDIITRKKLDAATFLSLKPRLIEALIAHKFERPIDWYKAMEQLLIAKPDLETKYIQQMLNRDKNATAIIKRYWKNNLTPMQIQQFFAKFWPGLGKEPKQH